LRKKNCKHIRKERELRWTRPIHPEVEDFLRPVLKTL
jgi:hypothetical protein